MRETLVTRLITITKLNVKFAKTKENTLEDKEIIMAGEVRTDDKALKRLKKEWKDSECTPISAEVIGVYKQLLGMSLKEFVKLAKPLDNKTRQFIDAKEEE